MRGFITGAITCDGCERTVPLIDAREIGGGLYCPDCAEYATEDLDAWNADAEGDE